MRLRVTKADDLSWTFHPVNGGWYLCAHLFRVQLCIWHAQSGGRYGAWLDDTQWESTWHDSVEEAADAVYARGLVVVNNAKRILNLE